MKGVVFTEFVEMVEDKFGFEVMDGIIDENLERLSTQGAYTAIGTYPHKEMLCLVSSLSQRTSTPVPDLLNAFGKHLLTSFVKNYPDFFDRCEGLFDFLSSIHNHIHMEVRKLYADAELPFFKTRKISDTEFEMIYTSERAMSDLALGLIEGSASYFNETVQIFRKDLTEDQSGKVVQLLVIK